ncbi:S1/P1 nuclease, partial [Novosphingobium sp. UBA6272]
MRRLAARLAAFSLLASTASAPAMAWSEESHQTTGAIAWIDLRQNHPAELAELLTLARQHQDYPRFAPFLQRLSPEQQERVLFEILARWPDDIRGGPEDQPEWHYQLQVVSGRTWLWPIENGAALSGFTDNFAKLSNPCAAPKQRAKAIGWLIHIIGDIQQPLHAGHQMTAAYSMTDRAGELAFVRRPSGEVTNLHQFWDKTIERGGLALPAGQPSWADALVQEWPRSRLPRELGKNGDPQALFRYNLTETAELARLFGYTGTFLLASPDQAAAPQVSEMEQAATNALAKRRIATGGYRIADLLARA